MSKMIYFLGFLLLAGCADTSPSLVALPKSIGEKNSGFTYVPLDPLNIAFEECSAAPTNYSLILDVLPDNAVRIATKKISGKANASFGPVGFGTAGETYKVVLDFVNVDNTNIPFQISIQDVFVPDPGQSDVIVEGVPMKGTKKRQYVVKRLAQERAFDENLGKSSREFSNTTVVNGIYVIPVYVGVGLRLTSEITVLRGNVNLSSLPAIAASVEAGNASGSLVIQTLGVTGKQISTGLIFSSDLNATTVQNAILSLGKIKAVLFSNDAVIRPRVTGIYLPLPDGNEELVNLIVSELAREKIYWNHIKC